MWAPTTSKTHFSRIAWRVPTFAVDLR
jgi:hypothetical protein